MRQVTLVALYGEKPTELSKLVADCQKHMEQALQGNFLPYDMSQIHATIAGLERVIGSAYLNLNLAKYRDKQEHMDFEGLLNFIRFGGMFPFQVQIGGFQNRDYPFTSRGQRPYKRSFSIQGDKAVLMGWPIRGQPLMNANPSPLDLVQESRIYPATLDAIRQAIQNFNVLHAYHRSLTDVDNDFYFRIGLVNQTSLDPSSTEIIERTIREFLSTSNPVIVEVTISDVYIASYEDEALPLNSTRVWHIRDSEVIPDFVKGLYE